MATAPRRPAARFALLAFIAAASLACQPAAGVPGASASAPVTSVLGYSAETHAKLARPNYAAAFPQDKVPQLRIQFAPETWQAMLDDMTKNVGARGNGQGSGMGMARPAGGMRVRPSGAPSGAPGAAPEGPGFFVGGPGMVPPEGGAMPPGGPGGMGGNGPSGSTWRPMWAEATLVYEGRAWEHVGIRFKGNSSLRSSWQSGTDKIPLKIDFDEHAEKYPAIKNQRFHGFKQLALSSNWSDAAAMRDTVVYDLLADAGLPACETAAYQVILDYGQGDKDLGLYTSIEVVDDTAVKRIFGNDDGNVYEGDGQGVSLAEGTRDRIQASFPKENNKDTDWKDLEALYDVLHDPLRTTDPTAWRAKLEAIFDVDVFLRWLAISAVIEHWDTYGGMTHNFYMYNNPASGKLTWISWDHNLVLGAMGGMGGPGGPGGMAIPAGGEFPVPPEGAFPMGDLVVPAPSAVPSGGASAAPVIRRGGMGRNTSVGKAEVTAQWPLIRFLLDDKRYYATYVSYLNETIKGPFEPTKMKAKYAKLGAMLKPIAGAADGGTAYQAALDALATATDARVKAVQDFLATPAAQVTVDPVVGPQ